MCGGEWLAGLRSDEWSSLGSVISGPPVIASLAGCAHCRLGTTTQPHLTHSKLISLSIHLFLLQTLDYISLFFNHFLILFPLQITNFTVGVLTLSTQFTFL